MFSSSYRDPDSFPSSNRENEDVFVILWRTWIVYERRKK